MALTTLRVHDGVLYEQDGSFWWPAYESSRHKDVPAGRFDINAPIVCDCGSTGFSVKSPPGEYETSIRCLKCGAEEVIHDG